MVLRLFVKDVKHYHHCPGSSFSITHLQPHYSLWTSHSPFSSSLCLKQCLRWSLPWVAFPSLCSFTLDFCDEYAVWVPMKGACYSEAVLAVAVIESESRKNCARLNIPSDGVLVRVAKLLLPIGEGAAKATSGGPHQYWISTSARTFLFFRATFKNGQSQHDSHFLDPETIDYLTH
jgi:hypothetical protein